MSHVDDMETILDETLTDEEIRTFEKKCAQRGAPVVCSSL
jgi:hypothetical protein